MNNKPNMQYLSPGVYRGPNGSLVGRNGQQLPGQGARPNMPQGPQPRQMMPQAPQNQLQRDYQPGMASNMGQMDGNMLGQGADAWRGNQQMFAGGTPNFNEQTGQPRQFNPSMQGMQRQNMQMPQQYPQPVPMTQEENAQAMPSMQKRYKQNAGRQGAPGVMGAPPSLTKSGQVGGY